MLHNEYEMRSVYGFFVSVIISLLVFAVSASAVEAVGFLKFDQTSYSAASGTTFQVQVIVDPGTDSIAGTDAYVTYDPTLLEAVSVSAGTYFSSVNNNIASGKVSIWGVTQPASPKTGVGTIATVTFRPLTGGTATLQYFCDASASNSSKIIKNDINATNIINCAQNQTASVAVTGGSVANPTPTTTAPGNLPQTGGFDNLPFLAIGGTLLLILGAAVRYIKL